MPCQGVEKGTGCIWMKIIHILQDGTVLDDITGHEVPEDHTIYMILGEEEEC